MVEPSKPRASGKSASQEEAAEISRSLAKTASEVDEVEQPVSLTRSFQRMRTDWQGKDRDVIQSVKNDVDQYIFDRFQDAYEIEYQIWDIVREKKFDPKTGEIEVDAYGLAVWKTRPDGSYIEDWSKIGVRERENLLYEIITRLFRWEQTAAEIRGEALFAKAVWEEAFAVGFDTASTDKKTVESRNAAGTRVSMDRRYLAVYKSMASDKAQAIIRSLDRICQRLKDLHV